MENEEGENKSEMYSSSCDYIQSFPGHGILLLQQLNMQRYYGSFCDITIRIDDIEYRAHRCILAASSAKLQSLIFSIRQEWNNVLVIKDVTSAAFQVILDYIYTGNVRLVATSVHDILESARFLKLPEVEKVCLTYIERMHSSEERNSGNPASLRLMPELAPITEVQIDNNQMSKVTEAQSFDAITNALERTSSARNQVLADLYGTKPGMSIFSSANNHGLSIDTLEDYIRLFEMRQNSLSAANLNHQNWSPFLETKTAENDATVHRVLPNLVRITSQCSSRLPVDQGSLVSEEGQRLKFSGYNFEKSIEFTNQKKFQRDVPATGLDDDEMFDLGSTDENHDEECASFLKMTSVMTPTSVATADETKSKLHLMPPSDSCIMFNSHNVIENFGTVRCENVDLDVKPDDFGAIEAPLLRLNSVDSTKRNRKKVPKKVRAAKISSSDESNGVSDSYDSLQLNSAVINSVKFPLSNKGVFAPDVPNVPSSASNGSDVLNSTASLEDVCKNSKSNFNDNRTVSKNSKKSNGCRTKGQEIKDAGTAHLRPFKKRVKIGRKRESKHSPLFACSVCGKRFGRSSELTRHQRNHSSQLYRCHYCEVEFTNPVLYKRHFICIHGERNAFFCVHPSCKFRSDRLSNLEKHMIIHTDVKSFTCSHCGKSFSQDNGLRSHLQSCTQAQTYLCDICGAKFNHLQSMRSHRRVHTGEKPYRCTDCGSQFADHRNFKRHRRIHENVFPYPCVFCDKRFRHSNSLKSHMSMHDVCPTTQTK